MYMQIHLLVYSLIISKETIRTQWLIRKSVTESDINYLLLAVPLIHSKCSFVCFIDADEPHTHSKVLKVENEEIKERCEYC